MQQLFLRCAIALGLILGTTLPVAADTYPNKPIRWVVPFPPGGAMDAIARSLGERLSKTMGQPVVIENRPGAGGLIGSDVVAKAAPDGHTLLIVSMGHAVNPSLYPKMSYDPVKDFEPVSLLAIVPNILVISPNFKANSVQELISLAKAQPGKITYASAGNGTSIHLAAEMFASMTGVDLVHVP